MEVEGQGMRGASAAAEVELAVVAAARAAVGSRPVVVEVATPGARVRVRATGDALLEVATAARLEVPSPWVVGSWSARSASLSSRRRRPWE
jgi:hypothetical protein